jgi:hypothetical protein
MKWSKLKKRIEEGFAPSLQGRLQLFSAVYDNAEQYGRVWLTLDKVEIANFCDYSSWNEHAAFYHETTTDLLKNHGSPKKEDRKQGRLIEKGEFSKSDVMAQLFHFLNISIEDALEHKSPIINGIAVLDKRVGKRRLNKLEFDHPLPSRLLQERRMAEIKKTIANKELN